MCPSVPSSSITALALVQHSLGICRFFALLQQWPMLRIRMHAACQAHPLDDCMSLLDGLAPVQKQHGSLNLIEVLVNLEKESSEMPGQPAHTCLQQAPCPRTSRHPHYRELRKFFFAL